MATGVLASPVPDLASTLTTQAEQDAEDDNLSFLRSETNAGDDADRPHNDWWRSTTENSPGAVGDGRQRNTSATARRYTPEQLRELNELEERAREIMHPEYQGTNTATPDPVEDDITMHRNSDPTEGGESSPNRDETALRDRLRIRRLRDVFAMPLSEGSSSHQEYADPPRRHPSRFVENGMASSPSSGESSLRTTALLQAVRRNTTMSHNTRSHLQRYILDRERGDQETEEGDPQRTNFNSPHLSPSQRRQMYRESVMRTDRRLAELDAQQRTHELEEQEREHQQPPRRVRRVVRHELNNGSVPTPPARSPVENIVRYLESLNLCESDAERHDTAEENGLSPEELCPHNVNDFLLDTEVILSPPSNSYLQAGSQFGGKQHGMPCKDVNRVLRPFMSSSTTSPFSSVPSANTLVPSAPWGHTEPPSSLNVDPVYRDMLRLREAHQIPEDKWPVKVTIHNVDYIDMSLSGTMTAFDVPDRTSATKKSRIVTYLEGEIIDFKKHTLRTKNFVSDTRIDAHYWRKLPPFSGMSDEMTMAKSLLSKDWLEESLMHQWILMRWKGMP